jgi:glutamine amidotransferase PdxT
VHRRPAGAAESDAAADSDDVSPVLLRQGSVVASAFHPELTPDRRVHRLFAQICGF